MIEDILDNEATIEDAKRKMYGVQIGRVINTLDPLMLGRVQVQLPSIDALDLAPWARVAVPMAGPRCGFYFIPEIGDSVVVAFEHGDINAPYIIGSLWSAMAPPPLQSPLPQVRCVRTISGNQLVFEELPPTITLQNGPTSPIPAPMPTSPVGPYSTVKLSPTGIDITNPVSVTITVGTTKISVNPLEIDLECGSASIKMTPTSIAMKASSDIQILAGGVLTLRGAVVNIN
jgi:phage baseplate assembly protein gpV